ncbi:MAG: heme o synthase [Dehalococcoidia bacterium]
MPGVLGGVGTAGSDSSIGVPARDEGRILADRRWVWATVVLYIRLGKPRVVGLLLLVTAISYVVAAEGTVVAATLALLMAAGALAAGGAAMVNSYWERDLDALMDRTRARPLAAGTIAHPEHVLWGGIGSMVAGAAVGLLINPLVALMLVAGALVYVLLYTVLLKRRTHWSVTVGGLAGSCAVFAGWFAGAPPSLVALLVGLLLFTWQSAHFWPLALARSADYERAGIPMLPAVVGPHRTGTYILVASAATAGLSIGLGLAANLGTLYLAGSFVVASLWLSVTGRLLIDPSQGMAWWAFKTSGIYLAAIFFLVLLDVVLVG